jgi:hypothetical protein
VNYLEKLDWNTLKADLEKGLNQGLVAVKRGALAVKKKTGELSEEGQRQYRLITLKAKVNRSMSELGARVYMLMHSGRTNPLLDAKVKDIAARIGKDRSTIVSLEKTRKKAVSVRTRTRKKAASALSSRSR